MAYSTPILLLVWKRPQHTKRVIDAMRLISPQRIFVACDGPVGDSEIEAIKVKATRDLIEKEIDWPCEVHYKYSDVNQGCRLGVSSAITWFFEYCDEGIILEDDCVPHPDFFNYCTILLEKYRLDSRVFSICGSNFQQGNVRGEASYYFSIHGDSWGWATWKRAWKHYNLSQQYWPLFRDSTALEDVFPIAVEREYWKLILDELFINKKPDSWAYQWWLSCWMNGGLSAWPNVNLVTNSGFDSIDATHTTKKMDFSDIPVSGLGEINHPKFILPNRQADAYAFYHRRSGHWVIRKQRLGYLYYPYRIISKLRTRILRIALPRS